MDFVSFLGESSKSRLFCLFDGAHSLADVLSRQDHVARPTPEAADVPLFLQRQEGLTLLDLVSAACAVWRRQEGRKGGRRREILRGVIVAPLKIFFFAFCKPPEASFVINRGANATEHRTSKCC